MSELPDPAPQPTYPHTLDTHELAWAAGFFDGEGHVSVIQSTPRPRDTRSYFHPALVVTQGDPGPLERFRAAVCGIGKVLGPYQTGTRADGTSYRPAWQFRVGSWADTQAVVALLWRWLSAPKRQAAQETLSFLNDTRRTRRDEELAAQSALLAFRDDLQGGQS